MNGMRETSGHSTSIAAYPQPSAARPQVYTLRLSFDFSSPKRTTAF